MQERRATALPEQRWLAHLHGKASAPCQLPRGPFQPWACCRARRAHASQAGPYMSGAIVARGLGKHSQRARRAASARAFRAAGTLFGRGNAAGCASGARHETQQYPAGPGPGGRNGACEGARKGAPIRHR
eukprot:10904969-Alexandrium_andersonii.AAC.1